VSIANTPSVSIAGTPTVSLAAGVSVGVTNPLDGQNKPTPLTIMEGVQLYEDSCSTVFNSSNSAGCYLHALPSGKRLVIQEFDADLLVGTGVKPASLLLNGTVYSHYFPAILMGNYNGDQNAAHQVHSLVYECRCNPAVLCNAQ
jgi:hypothetical protein